MKNYHQRKSNISISTNPEKYPNVGCYLFSYLLQAQYPEIRSVLSEPQQALVSTISAGQEAIENAHSLLNEKAKLPPLGNDPASVRYVPI